MESSPTLFSYVVDHDNGYAPNPYFGCCTLCGCKLGKNNVLRLAKEGDWIVGTGGSGELSVGHGKLIYAMRVDKKISRWQYWRDPHFRLKKPDKNGPYKRKIGDNQDPRKDEDEGKHFVRAARRLEDRKHRQYVLISRHFWYFGKEAIPLPKEFRGETSDGFHLEKRGQGFRNHFRAEEIQRVIHWLEKEPRGIHGEPRGKQREEDEKCRSSC